MMNKSPLDDFKLEYEYDLKKKTKPRKLSSSEKRQAKKFSKILLDIRRSSRLRNRIAVRINNVQQSIVSLVDDYIRQDINRHRAMKKRRK